MINGLEGIPGSGKSYEAVVMHVLPALKQGRLIITNLPLLVEAFQAVDPTFGALIELRMKSQPVLGIWDAEAVDDKGNGEAFKLADVRHFDAIKNVPVFGSVWDYYSQWKHPVTGQGPLFIIDEAHLALPTVNTNQEVIEWYKLHRHFNADVLLATQSFRDINQPIARLIAMLIRCRKADILGKKDSYIRKVHAGYRGAVISQEERKYEPQFFGLYRSHTQGNSVVEAAASDVTPLYVKLRRVTRIVWAVAIAACIGAGMYACRDKGPKAGQIGVVSTTTTSIGPPPGVNRPAWLDDLPPAPARASSAAGKSSAAGDEKIDLEPLKDKLVHITGWLKSSKGAVYTFTVSGQGIRQFDVLGADLVAAGYVWRPLGECIGYLMWEGKTRAVTCDAPAIHNGSGNAPVVIDAGSGSRSDDGVRNAPPEERPLTATRPKA